MALTKVTSASVKDNELVNADLHTAANIDGSKLADDSISLAKLEHGTSSNNGKFLRANNGADPTFETVSSVGGSTGADFNDNVAIRFGTDNDLIISHNPSSANMITAANGKNIYLNSANVAIFNEASNSTTLWSNGTNIELFHANTKKFETLSTGVRAQGGICFGSDTAVANHLDDYEEGSWTPAPENLSNTPSYYNLVGKYTKVGRLVTIWGMIQVGATSPTFHNNASDLHIAGLPFANNDTTGYIGGAGPVTFQSWNIFGGTYNNYGANGTVTCGTANSTRILFQVNPHSNGGIRGTARRNCLESGGPIITWTMTYQTTA